MDSLAHFFNLNKLGKSNDDIEINLIEHWFKYMIGGSSASYSILFA